MTKSLTPRGPERTAAPIPLETAPGAEQGDQSYSCVRQQCPLWKRVVYCSTTLDIPRPQQLYSSLKETQPSRACKPFQWKKWEDCRRERGMASSAQPSALTTVCSTLKKENSRSTLRKNLLVDHWGSMQTYLVYTSTAFFVSCKLPFPGHHKLKNLYRRSAMDRFSSVVLAGPLRKSNDKN